MRNTTEYSHDFDCDTHTVVLSGEGMSFPKYELRTVGDRSNGGLPVRDDDRSVAVLDVLP